MPNDDDQPINKNRGEDIAYRTNLRNYARGDNRSTNPSDAVQSMIDEGRKMARRTAERQMSRRTSPGRS